MKTEVICVTPAFAKSLLAKNASFQRNPSRLTVKNYADAMKRGEWRLTHQGIATDVNGNLIDGQHRLMAVVESNMTIPMTLFSGVPESSFTVLDIGKKRDLADLLYIPKAHAAIVNRIGIIVLGMRVLSSDQAKSIYNPLKEIIEYTNEASLGGSRNSLTSASAQAAFAMHILENPHDRKQATQLYRNMISFKIEELPPIGIALVSQVARGVLSAGGETNRKQLFDKLLYALDPSKSEIGRVNISTDYATSRVLALRETVKAVIGK